MHDLIHRLGGEESVATQLGCEDVRSVRLWHERGLASGTKLDVFAMCLDRGMIPSQSLLDADDDQYKILRNAASAYIALSRPKVRSA